MGLAPPPSTPPASPPARTASWFWRVWPNPTSSPRPTSPAPAAFGSSSFPGARMMLRPAEPGSTLRTACTAVLVEVPGDPDAPPAWVSLDTGLPNRIVGEALEAGTLEEFAGWTLVRREVPVGRSRLDFLLTDLAGRSLYLEVKSVTLVEDDGVARLPDTVASRGARHVDEFP